MALEQGWRKVGMVATLGAYGDEGRTAFKNFQQRHQAEWDAIKKISKSRANMKWFKAKIDDVF
jgi:hypothetical protein